MLENEKKITHGIAYFLSLLIPSKCMLVRMTASPSHCSSIDSASKYTEDWTNLDEDFITTAKLSRKSLKLGGYNCLVVSS